MAVRRIYRRAGDRFSAGRFRPRPTSTGAKNMARRIAVTATGAP